MGLVQIAVVLWWERYSSRSQPCRRGILVLAVLAL
jgi:hypothetical protein